MATGKPLSLKHLIDGSGSAVGKLIERSAKVEAMTREVRQLVPAPLQPHILAACRRGDTLYLVADTPAWAAKLRYLANDIRISVNTRQGLSLQKLQVSVSRNA